MRNKQCLLNTNKSLNKHEKNRDCLNYQPKAQGAEKLIFPLFQEKFDVVYLYYIDWYAKTSTRNFAQRVGSECFFKHRTFTDCFLQNFIKENFQHNRPRIIFEEKKFFFHNRVLAIVLFFFKVMQPARWIYIAFALPCKYRVTPFITEDAVNSSLHQSPTKISLVRKQKVGEWNFIVFFFSAAGRLSRWTTIQQTPCKWQNNIKRN